jgi:hypothetical protein
MGSSISGLGRLSYFLFNMELGGSTVFNSVLLRSPSSADPAMMLTMCRTQQAFQYFNLKAN